ncbi:ion channel [Variovorax sp. J22P271]|uniref:ion channel n=1 Tax=Variovorax TaxID=34072 RepID=UPI002577B2EE|nr:MULTISPECIES: ion channel [unclassified Variovorax]MDM0031979.1 ion channel [Variovorax sp. J22P271]MDM0065335.1 ion channel [Variovorax sp. J31P207]MDM0084797.1 ion channel [Variovorax sp. J31P179]
MLINLAIGLPTILLCLVLQAAFTFWSVRYYIDRSMRVGFARPLVQIRSLLVAMLVLVLGNFLQIMIWGSLFMVLGEFDELYEAVYHSAVNFSSLGYGDVVMTKPWKLLGPLEAGNGVLMFGLTGAALMAMLQQMIKAQAEKGSTG